MKESDTQLNERIAARVRELRTAQTFSLDTLASKSGVSRSMISLIERGESSPTAVVLEKLAAALNVTLASLFETPNTQQAAQGPLVRHSDQPVWRDPASGYTRRNISPPASTNPIQIVEIHFPAGGRVAFESGTRELRIHQQIWVLEGTIDVTIGEARHRLEVGDCLAMQLEGPTMFHNPTRKTARYAVISTSENVARRR